MAQSAATIPRLRRTNTANIVYSARVTEDTDKPLDIELRSSSAVCAGSATAYLCKAIAHRAGTYAPGISESVFARLYEHRFGRRLDDVGRWFSSASTDLAALGYRLCARRVAFRTPLIERWVGGGEGFRGAILATAGEILHQGVIRPHVETHAIGLVAQLGASQAKKAKTGGPSSLMLIDPWPNVVHKRAVDGPATKLESAHRLRQYGTLLIFWAGFS